MKYIPILFSTPMVIAIIEGRKQMTRRILKPQPIVHNDVIKMPLPISEYSKKLDELSKKGFKRIGTEGITAGLLLPEWKYVVGDVLWVRETFTVLEPEHCMGGMRSRFVFKADCDADSDEARKDYIANGYPYQWKPSLFMPKAACRIFLEVTEIRVERLQEISEEDAVKEGIECNGINKPIIYRDYLSDGAIFRHSTNGIRFSPINSFETLWQSINGKDSWEANPWVWLISFKRIEKPADFC